MVTNGFFADKQLLGDFFGCLVLHQKLKHFPLPVGQQGVASSVPQMMQPFLARALDLQGSGTSQVILCRGSANGEYLSVI